MANHPGRAIATSTNIEGRKALAKFTGLRTELAHLRTQLQNERSSFRSHWRDLSDYIVPRRSRFFVQDVNRGDRRSQKINDITATLAARTLQAGMMSGITSPARPWFRLNTVNQELNEVATVKEWLEDVERRMRTVFLKSNIYNSLPILYGDLGVFGTSAMFVEEDFEQVIRTYVFPIGSYYVANDEKLRVRVFMREFQMTVRQLVDMFGRRGPGVEDVNWKNISIEVRNFYENGEFETPINITHVVRPNPQHKPDMLEARFKRFQSVYYEDGSSTNQHGSSLTREEDVFLRVSGFDRFPVLAPRWSVTGEDTYATSSPGMIALGDIKQLQLGEKRSMQAIEKMVNPPMLAPTALRTVRTSILPGDITYTDEREGQKGFRPAHEVTPRIAELEAKQEQVRVRIRRAFFEDLFLMLATTTRRQITAREIEERHEEKLLALGPVLEQLNQDLLDPLIDITFDRMFEQGLIPDPPEELQGTELRVDYVSVLAEAQKLIGIGSLERLASFVGEVGRVNPETLDKVDWDQMVDEYGERISAPATVIRTDEDVEILRDNRAQQQQAAAAAEATSRLAGAAKDLSAADLEKDSALKRLIEGGGTQPIPGA